MVEVGSIQIGGTIQTSDIERGMNRIETGFKDVSRASKSVEADFDRMAARGRKLVTILASLTIAGTTAMIGLAKDAPAVAGSMARINLAMTKLKMAAGRALKPTFESAANALNRLANWVNEHPDLFRGIINSIMGLAVATGIIKVGGWVYNAFKTFFGLFGKMANWSGWATIGGWFSNLGTWAKNMATKIAGAFSTVLSWFSKIGGALKNFAFGGTSSGILSSIFSTSGIVGAIGLGPLVNTYQREITGQPGFLDKSLRAYQEYMFTERLKKMTRKEAELDMIYMV